MNARNSAARIQLAGAVLIFGGALLGSSAIASNKPHDSTSIRISQHSGPSGSSKMTLSISRNGEGLKAQFDGEPKFNDAEDELIELKGGDRGWLEETRAGAKHRVDYTQSAGHISVRYRINDVDAPFDAAAQEWLRSQLQTLMREAALNVEARTARRLAAGGPEKVFAEIELIHSDYARGRYLAALLDQATLDARDAARYLALVDAMDGDYESSQALQWVVKSQKLDTSSQVLLLDAVRGMDSDYEQGQVLQAVSPSLRLADPAVQAAWVGAIAGIGSDYEATQALQAVAPKLDRAPGLATRYAEATRRIDSDYEQLQALNALLNSGPLDTPAYEAILDAGTAIESSYERGQLLTAVAADMPNDPALIARYRAMTRTMGDYERGQAERALDRFAR